MDSLERIVLALLQSGSRLDPKALVAKAKEILAELAKEQG